MKLAKTLQVILAVSIVCVLYFAARTVQGIAQTPTPSGQILTITKLADTDDGICDNDCTLREAIENASWGAVIKYAANLRGTSNLGDYLTIQNKNVEIQGPTDKSFDLTLIGANYAGETIQVLRDSQVKIKNLTIKKGRIGNYGTLTLEGISITGNDQTTGLVSGIDSTTNVTNSLFFQLDIGLINGGTLNMNNSTFYRISHTGMMTTDGVSYVNNTTFAEIDGIGGAVYTRHYGLSGGRLVLANSIVSNKNSFIGACSGEIEDGGGNLQFVLKSCGGNIISADPLLADFGDHGGPTWTVALQAKSPAIGGGIASICKQVGNTDQRGITRLSDNDQTCDIGAYETQP